MCAGLNVVFVRSCRQKKIKQLKQQQEQEEKALHPFSPMISRKSAMLASNVNGAGPIHERLIQQGEVHTALLTS